MGVIENRIDITELERSGGGTAAHVAYDNTDSGLTATTVQGAIDELAEDVAAPAADDVTYDNTSSGLTATNVQAAIDEVTGDLAALTAVDVAYVNTTSGLTATDVQSAIDEVVTESAGKDQISNRNLLDNGWFTVNQRGKSSYTSENNTPEYTLDRWCGIQLNRKAIKPKGNYGITVDFTGAESMASWFCLTQLLEAKESASLCGKSVTLSIRVSNIQNMDEEPITVRIYDSNSVDSFPSGSEIGRLIVANNGTSKATFTIPASLTNGNLLIAIYATTSATDYATAKFDIDAIKLEIGSVSTLDMDAAPNYAEELLKCQRYFQRIYTNNSYGFLSSLGFVITTSQARFPVLLSAPLRSAPTITSGGSLRIAKTSTITSTITAISVTTFSGNMVWVALDTSDTLTAGDDCLIAANNDATAHIDLSADL